MEFPIFRKLRNDRAFYKINSAEHFEELMVLGEKVHHFSTKAVQYPEKLRIMDMIDHDEFHYMPSSEKEWNTLFSRIP